MDINSNINDVLILQFGAHNAGVIPVLIPNTEVKPSSADYTAMRETRKVPNYQKTTLRGGFLISRVIIGTLKKSAFRPAFLVLGGFRGFFGYRFGWFLGVFFDLFNFFGFL